MYGGKPFSSGVSVWPRPERKKEEERGRETIKKELRGTERYKIKIGGEVS